MGYLASWTNTPDCGLTSYKYDLKQAGFLGRLLEIRELVSWVCFGQIVDQSSVFVYGLVIICIFDVSYRTSRNTKT